MLYLDTLLQNVHHSSKCVSLNKPRKQGNIDKDRVTQNYGTTKSQCLT